MKISILVGTLLLAGAAQAATFEYTGALADPNQIFEVIFTVTQANTTITAQTFGWHEGDFDPVLWLFSSTMQQITKNDDACNGQGCSPVNRDSLINATLGPGTYTLVLTTFDQHWWVYGTPGTPPYVTTTGWSYMGDFSGLPPNYDLVLTTGSAIAAPNTQLVFPPHDNAPEPSSALLIAAGGALLAWGSKRRRAVIRR